MIDVELDDGADEPERPRKVIAVGAGRGGVGKGLVAANLAIYFAQLGKTVVLVDADASGTNLHAQFDLPSARREASLDDLEQALVPTSVPGLSLLPAAHDAAYGPSLLRAGRKARWLSRLRAIPADYLVIDAGPGAGNFSVDLLLAADVPIAVTAPDPAAVETTYRFVRAAYRRRLRRALLRDKFRMHLFERAIADLDALPAPLDLVRTLAKMDRTLAELAWAEARKSRLYLVVNQTRMRGDIELGGWMSMLSLRHYGVALDELGHVEHDDTVWLSARRRRPLLVDSPTCKAARNLERIGRRVVALIATKSTDVRVPSRDEAPAGPPTLYEVLGVTRTASDEEVRRAYKSQRDVYATGSIATSSLLDPEQLRAAQARLEEAYDTLLDSMRRRAYDLSTFPDSGAPSTSVSSKKPHRAAAAEQEILRAELAREIGPDTEFSGATLRKVREAQGVELAEISERTKIGRLHLAALEDENWEALPAAVYVRGFLVELAKFLKLDPAQVQRTYLRRMRELAAGRSE